MAKSKKREKVKRRGAEPAKKSGGAGSMMSMRSGFKGVAGSLVGKQSTSKKTRRVVEIFWWIVTVVVGALAIYLLYNRFK